MQCSLNRTLNMRIAQQEAVGDGAPQNRVEGILGWERQDEEMVEERSMSAPVREGSRRGFAMTVPCGDCDRETGYTDIRGKLRHVHRARGA